MFPIVIGLWLVLQLLNGIGSIAGVAYMAHIGGFVLTFLFRAGAGCRPEGVFLVNSATD